MRTVKRTKCQWVEEQKLFLAARELLSLAATDIASIISPQCPNYLPSKHRNIHSQTFAKFLTLYISVCFNFCLRFLVTYAHILV